ncbi:hypothetical protein Tco_0490069 [Tanacetum coccineum]
MPPKKTTTPMSDVSIKALVARSVADSLAEHKADKSRNGDDSHDSRSGKRRQMPTAREGTYSDFLKCQPLNFKGTEGVVRLTQWFERMESVFHISNCTVENQVKFATCTLIGVALTCEIKKLEIEIWNLKVKGTDVVSYTQRFQELALMCGRMFPEESDQKVRAYAERQTENKRKFDNNNQAQQQHPRKQSMAIAYTASDCPKFKNRNHGNQAEGTEARGMVYALGGGEINQDIDDMEDDINA